MNDYELIAMNIQEKVDMGELTIEEANYLNDRAYEMYVSEAARYKVEQERHFKKMQNEKEKIRKLGSKLETLREVQDILIRQGKFEPQKEHFKEKENNIKNEMKKSTELLEKMKKSKLYTGDEYTYTYKDKDLDGMEVMRKRPVWGTLYYGKQKAREKAGAATPIRDIEARLREERLRRSDIEYRKILDRTNGLTS